MRHLFQRASYTMAAALIAIAGSAIMASPAQAAPRPTELDVAARVQGCAFTGCIQDSVVNAVGTDVMTHCTFNDDFTLVYTANRRGGFVRTTSLVDQTGQITDCDDAGIFAQVVGGHSGKMYSCASTTCVDIGDIFTSDIVGVLCSRVQSGVRFYLIFDKDFRSEDGGFVRAVDLAQNPIVPTCAV